MDVREGLVAELQNAQKFFNASTQCLEQNDSAYAPQPELYTVAAHVEHTARTVEWFVEGAFGQGWDTDFESHIQRARETASLADAREHLTRAFEHAVRTIRDASLEQLYEPIPDKQIMPGAPRIAIVGAITDHTAHHRGALTVYARLLGKTPAMPYG